MKADKSKGRLNKKSSIVISGPAAVGKTTLAEGLAKEFGYSIYNGGDILKNIAKDRGYRITGKDWWDTTEAARFMEERKNDISFDLMVDETLTEIVANGEVVITSYTLPWLTRIPLTFWLSASAESRSERMAERDNINVCDALKIIQSRDHENRRIYKKIYGPKFGEDFQVFDIVLNTELLSLEALIDISKRIVKKIKR